MKNVLILAAMALLFACNPGEQGTSKTEATDAEVQPVVQGVGFNTMLPELKWQLGSEAAVQIVKDLDKAWAARDYEAMRTFFSDTAECTFDDGKIAKSGDEFVEVVKAEMEGAEVSWTFDYAFSVDLDPTRGGEHVQAGFTGTGSEGGVESKKYYHEWYYIIDGKIVMWRQYAIDNVKE
jgi:hypothetical protein